MVAPATRGETALRSKSYLFLLVVLVLGVVSGIGYATLKYRLGLDIQGGVRFTYQMDTSKLTTEQKGQLGSFQNRLVQIMQNRAVGPLGVTEPTVTKKGVDQIVIELPGFKDSPEKAQETMGSSARIEFYWAKNVASPLDENRPYIPSDVKDTKDIAISFTQKFGDKTPITYNLPDGKGINPRYQDNIKRWDLILAGDDLAKAEGTPQGTGGAYIPLLTFSAQGAKKMEAWSRAHPQENIAAVLDGKVLSINSRCAEHGPFGQRGGPRRLPARLRGSAFGDSELRFATRRSQAALVRERGCDDRPGCRCTR